MGVKVARVVPALGHGVVQGEVGYHAARRELIADIRLHQLAPRISRQLVRQRDVDFPCQLGVRTGFHPLDRVPKFLAVGQPRRAALGHDDLAVRHALLAAVVLGLVLALVAQLLPCPIGRCRHGVVGLALGAAIQGFAALAAPQHLRAEMINRHVPSL